MDTIDFALFASACHLGARLAQAVELDEAHCRPHESQAPPTVQLLCTVQHSYTCSHAGTQPQRRQTKQTQTQTNTQPGRAEKQGISRGARVVSLGRSALQRARWEREQRGGESGADLDMQLVTRRKGAWCADEGTRTISLHRGRAGPGRETWDTHNEYEHETGLNTNDDDDDENDDDDAEMSGLDGDGDEDEDEDENGDASEPMTPPAYAKKLSDRKAAGRGGTMARHHEMR